MAHTKPLQDLLAKRITSPADFPSPPVTLVRAWHNDSGGLLLAFSNGKFIMLSEYYDHDFSDAVLLRWNEDNLAEFVSFGLISVEEKLAEEQAEASAVRDSRERYRRIVAAISAERDED